MALPSNPTARYLAADLAGTHGEGDPVASWPDATGNGHDLAQPDPAMQPVFRVDAVNGHPAVDFLNIGTRLLIASPFLAPLASSTWGGVVYFDSLLSSTRVWWDGGGSRHATFYDGSQRWAMFAGTVRTASSGPAAQTSHRLVARFSGATSGLWVDGARVISGDPGPQALDRVVLGAEADGDVPADVLMPEVIVYDRALSDDEVADLDAYLAQTYLDAPAPVEISAALAAVSTLAAAVRMPRLVAAHLAATSTLAAAIAAAASPGHLAPGGSSPTLVAAAASPVLTATGTSPTLTTGGQP